MSVATSFTTSTASTPVPIAIFNKDLAVEPVALTYSFVSGYTELVGAFYGHELCNLTGVDDSCLEGHGRFIRREEFFPHRLFFTEREAISALGKIARRTSCALVISSNAVKFITPNGKALGWYSKNGKKGRIYDFYIEPASKQP